ncbi:MAG: hypothetical protein HYU37_14665 [Acidobacteria bacterium]|nr:hypothetical protein [Acidobacteriota bacterium]
MTDDQEPLEGGNQLTISSAPKQSLVAIFFTLMVALLVAVATIRHDPQPPYLSGNYSPLGYTISLAIFVIPCFTLGSWFIRQRHLHTHHWRAFWITAAIVVPMWCLVDILLGNTFFRFPNPGATLGVFAPGYAPGRGWPRTIPIEEFVFYASGCFTILLGYIWMSYSWLSAYTMPESAYLARVRNASRLVVIHVPSLVTGALLFLAALAWKNLGRHEYPGGVIPGYFLFELALVIGPTAVLYSAVGSFINRPAFVAKTLVLLLVSLMWEATMALPYGWWGYQYDAMMGIVIHPWFDLPIEAVVLWPAAAYMNVCLFEMVRLCLHRDRPLGRVLFGGPLVPTTAPPAPR